MNKSKSVMRRLAIQQELISDCCQESVSVEGKTTNYPICNACGKPCDAKTDTPPSPPPANHDDPHRESTGAHPPKRRNPTTG